MMPQAIWLVFLFALGACVGSFLNVVGYRLPLGMSLIRPGSHCFGCGAAVAWYDNIPILSWFILRGRCRRCGARFSIRYSLVELLTALLFMGVYYAYFMHGTRGRMPAFEAGGWSIYAGHMLLLSVLLASSLIDLDHMIIDLRLVRGCAVAGMLLSMFWPYTLGVRVAVADMWWVAPYATGKTAGVALGGGIGLIVAMVLVRTGVLKRSYVELEQAEEDARKAGKDDEEIEKMLQEMPLSIYRVIGRELLFVAPIVLGAFIGWRVICGSGAAAGRWTALLAQQQWLAGLLGSVLGYLVGGGVVWATRILGSLAFRKEAMGSGDIDLMAAVGAVLGAFTPAVAFFVAPFFGLGWAIVRLVVHRTREIPYGPFLSMGTLVVMVWHDKIVTRFFEAFVTP